MRGFLCGHIDRLIGGFRTVRNSLTSRRLAPGVPLGSERGSVPGNALPFVLLAFMVLCIVGSILLDPSRNPAASGPGFEAGDDASILDKAFANSRDVPLYHELLYGLFGNAIIGVLTAGKVPDFIFERFGAVGAFLYSATIMVFLIIAIGFAMAVVELRKEDGYMAACVWCGLTLAFGSLFLAMLFVLGTVFAIWERFNE